MSWDAYAKGLRSDSIDTTQIDAMKMPTQITAAQIQCTSFGIDGDEADNRRVFVLTKKEKNNPRGEDIYALVYREREAAEQNRDHLNREQDRWVFSVRETIFSGPYNG